MKKIWKLSALFFVGLFLFSCIYLKDGIGGFIVAVCLIAFIAAIFVLATGFILKLLRLYRNEGFFKAWIGVGIALFIFMLASHFVMSYQLLSLKKEFIAATKGSYSIELAGYDPDGNPYRQYNYQGALDKIIAERNNFLAEHGFRALGSWVMISSLGPTFRSVYIFWPFGG